MISIPNYEIIKVIGHGSFGIIVLLFNFQGYVFEAYDHTCNKKVALKRI